MGYAYFGCTQEELLLELMYKVLGSGISTVHIAEDVVRRQARPRYRRMSDPDSAPLDAAATDVSVEQESSVVSFFKDIVVALISSP